MTPEDEPRAQEILRMIRSRHWEDQIQEQARQRAQETFISRKAAVCVKKRTGAA